MLVAMLLGPDVLLMFNDEIRDLTSVMSHSKNANDFLWI